MSIGNTDSTHDDRIAAVILDLCTKRGHRKTICPSEAARALTQDGNDWRACMEDIRRVGAALKSISRIQVTQSGKPVDPLTAKGPIRFQLARGPA